MQEKLASRGLRRMTLRGNKLDASLMKLDTDVQEEIKKNGGKKSKDVVVGSKMGSSFGQKMNNNLNLGGIQEGDEDEDEED